VRLNSKWALDRPPRRCRIDLLDLHDVTQKAWEILKITIEVENLLDRASDDHTCCDRIVVW
jgi:hypothetical protein